jgi:hypothetical protein
MNDDPFDLENLRLPDELVQTTTRTPRKIEKRSRGWTKLPGNWYDKLAGTSGSTHRVAWYLLHLHWKGNGAPIKLANGMLEIDGVSRWAKYRALEDLEERDLIKVDRRLRKSPTIRLNPDYL